MLEEELKPTLRTGYNLARVGSNVHTRDRLVVAGQFILELEAAALSRIQVHVVLASYGQCLAIGREGVVRNWMVEEVADFWGDHCDVRVQ
jgi:hypothetical protein